MYIDIQQQYNRVKNSVIRVAQEAALYVDHQAQQARKHVVPQKNQYEEPFLAHHQESGFFLHYTSRL